MKIVRSDGILVHFLCKKKVVCRQRIQVLFFLGPLLWSVLFLAMGSCYAAKFQFNFNIGQDNPDDGADREGGATLIKFGLSTKPQFFRWNSSFIYMTGSNQFSQGDFTIGASIYPLASVEKSPAQPFLFVEGKIGFGTLDDQSRMDTGFGLGAGVDIMIFKESGLTLAIAN